MNSEDRKLCILAAVRGLFCKKGLSVTSKELSKAAGVSEALIYKHFDSKEDLYKALVEKSCRGHEEVGQELASLKPSTEVLVCATYLMIHIITAGTNEGKEDFSLSPEETRGLLLQSFQTDGEVARTLFEQGLAPWVQYFVSSMQAAKKSGDLEQGPMDFDSLVWLAHHAVMGIKMTLHPTPDAFMAKAQTEQKLKNNTLIFALRGMGLRLETIKEIMKSNNFKQFIKKIDSPTGDRP